MDRVDQRGFKNQRSDFMEAKEAAKTLGVKLQTLYAYASRGLVRSEPGPKGRGRRYARSDVERLKARGEARAGHGPVAAGALRWGEPVLSTAISSIEKSGPAYRGRSAVELALSGLRFEAVAELLWRDVLDVTATFSKGTIGLRHIRGLPAEEAYLPRLLAAVPRIALADTDRFGAPKEAEWARARRLVHAMVDVIALDQDDGTRARVDGTETVAEAMSFALGTTPRRARAIIDRTLILIADHELNVSTFATRIVASTGADLYACVTGGLAALSGPRHGAYSDRVEALLDEIETPARAPGVIQARCGRGEAIPGFGHPLYPEGDPRVPPLLEAAREVAGKSSRLATVFAVLAAMERARREAPNVDFALVAAVRSLGLRRGSATALFAVGRSAGWIAHALEQRDAGYLLRPRATYVGR